MSHIYENCQQAGNLFFEFITFRIMMVNNNIAARNEYSTSSV